MPAEKGTYVYIKKDPKSCNWIPAIQLKTTKGNTHAVVKVPAVISKGDGYDVYGCGSKDMKSTKFAIDNVTIDLKDYPNHTLPRQNVDASGNIEEYKDMVQLPYLHEAAILYNLKLRHKLEKPYTRTGDIVFAVNPYKWYHNLYTADKRSYYASRIVWDKSSNEDPRLTMEPHVYEVSALSYKGLAHDTEHRNQSILVSGESGAGKTETVKICLNHIAQVQAGPNSHYRGEADHHGNHDVVQRVVDSNPLLEAFGNAQTRRNDNSSRFGKFLQLQFDKTKQRELVGSTCDVYLLEKSRVVHHDAVAERNFHIFYQLLASSTKGKYWNKLQGTTNESFKYIGSTKTNTIEGMTDADRFDHTIDSLQLVNVTNEKLHDLIKALCIVLQLGNVSFTAKHVGDHDISKVTNMKDLDALSELMGIPTMELATCLTERTFRTRDEVHKVPLNVNQAKESCDAFAKEAYERSFLWLVNAINEATSATKSSSGSHKKKKFATIGLLDIFGFESFPMNGYEQLCINYANEKLQQKFNQDIFDNVKAEYEREGIDLDAVEYEDNTDVLQLIEGKTGLLALLNEECVRPKGNDFDFVQKAFQINNKSSCLIINKTDRLSFGIHHYAGVVMYHGECFVVKNLDTIATDLQDCMATSKNMVIRTKIEPDVDINESTLSYPSSPRKPMAQQDRSKSSISAPTVWTKYKSQLSVLMRNLAATQSRYIRCIKPNDKKKPLLMEHENVVNQLRYSGVVAAITISRNCFANRLPNSVVLARYGFQVDSYVYKSKSSGTPEEKRSKECQALMEYLLKSKEFTKNGKSVSAFVVGKTTTYFRAGALEHLECNRSREHDSQAIVIQRAVRRWYQKALVGKSRQRKRQEAAEKLAREKALAAKRAQKMKEEEARRNQRSKKQEELEDILSELENEIAIDDKICTTAVREIEKRSKATEDRIKELQDEQKEIQEQQLTKLMSIKASQEKKIHQAGQLISMLKKENGKLRRKQERAKGQLDEVSERSAKMEAFRSKMENSIGSEGFTNDKSDRVYSSLKEEFDDMRNRNNAVRTKINETTEMYNVTAGARLEYQRAMVKILHMVEDHVKKRKLQEEIVTIAFDAERAANLEKAELDMITGGGGIDEFDVSASQTY